MQVQRRSSIFSLVAAVSIGGLCSTVVYADTDSNDQDTIAELRTRVTQLEQEMSSSRQQEGEKWLTEIRATEIRSLVQDVLNDADSRSSLLQGGGTAGHDGHFFLSSADGNFHLELAGQIQFRYVFNHQDNDDAGSIDSTRQGFEVRRAKLVFSGHIIDPTIQYKVNGAFDRLIGTFRLEDAYIKKNYDNGWNIKVGQFKLPFLREELVSSKRQLAVDRTLMNEEDNQDRSQGIQFEYQGESFKFSTAISDGFGSKNSGALVEDIEAFAGTARVEILFDGNWKQFKDFTSFNGEDFAFMLGGAVHYQVDEYGTVTGPEEKRFVWTVDGSLEFGGANMFAALVGRHLDNASKDQYGFAVQGGVFFTDDWEAFARYEWIDFDTTSIEDLSIITFGVNRYFDKHNLKWTTDVGIGLNEVDAQFSSSGAGWRADTTGEDTQIVIRSQLQLLF